MLRSASMFLVTAFLICYGSISAQSESVKWGAPIAGLSLGVALVTPRVAKNGTIGVNISIKNVSGRSRAVRPANYAADYRFTIFANGVVVAQQSPKPQMNVYSGPFEGETLEKGRYESHTIDVGQLYDLAPGNYTLKVSLPLIKTNESSAVTLEAPAIALTIY